MAGINRAAFASAAALSRPREPAPPVSVEDALRNFMGWLDTPIGRRRLGHDPMYADCIAAGREALGIDQPICTSITDSMD